MLLCSLSSSASRQTACECLHCAQAFEKGASTICCSLSAFVAGSVTAACQCLKVPQCQIVLTVTWLCGAITHCQGAVTKSVMQADKAPQMFHDGMRAIIRRLCCWQHSSNQSEAVAMLVWRICWFWHEAIGNYGTAAILILSTLSHVTLVLCRLYAQQSL